MKLNVKEEGIRELIVDYFKIDILEVEPLTPDSRKNIVETFTYCWERHLSIQAICKELQGSNLSELRDRIIKRMGSNYNPFPIRLGSIKPALQSEAMACDKSLHGYILSILRKR